MKNLFIIKSKASGDKKCNATLPACLSLFLILMLALSSPSSAQMVLFDFDSAPMYTPLPISQTVSGITAHLSGTGQSYSIQAANTMGFTPAGFAGNCIYPSSVYLSDLLISFDQTLTDFSINYSPQELACDDAETMRITAYMNGTFVGTNTRMTNHPGTWPTDTLRCTFVQGFDSVVIHYDSHPPTCADYGVIFLADNMRVTAFTTAISQPKISMDKLIIPNPISQSTVISFSLLQTENLKVAIYDTKGCLLKNLFDGRLNAGEHQLYWDVNADAPKGGVYFLSLRSDNFSRCCKLVVVK